MRTINGKKYKSIAEVAALLGCTQQTVRNNLEEFNTTTHGKRQTIVVCIDDKFYEFARPLVSHAVSILRNFGMDIHVPAKLKVH